MVYYNVQGDMLLLLNDGIKQMTRKSIQDLKHVDEVQVFIQPARVLKEAEVDKLITSNADRIRLLGFDVRRNTSSLIQFLPEKSGLASYISSRRTDGCIFLNSNSKSNSEEVSIRTFGFGYTTYKFLDNESLSDRFFSIFDEQCIQNYLKNSKSILRFELSRRFAFKGNLNQTEAIRLSTVIDSIIPKKTLTGRSTWQSRAKWNEKLKDYNVFVIREIYVVNKKLERNLIIKTNIEIQNLSENITGKKLRNILSEVCDKSNLYIIKSLSNSKD